MTRGIYAYIDKETNKIVYVGKDSYIHEGRRKQQHLSPYKYDQQPFNKILQNNPDRYIYKVLEEGDFSDDMLDALEKKYIRQYNTHRPCTGHGWNFTIGGDGSLGYRHTLEARKKISEIQIGKKLSQEHKFNISRKHNTTGYYRVYKDKDSTCKQGFLWCYGYRDEEGKKKKITSVDLSALEKKVKDRSLLWRKI